MRKGLHLPLTFHFCLFLLLLWVLTPQSQEETLGLTGSGGGWVCSQGASGQENRVWGTERTENCWRETPTGLDWSGVVIKEKG